MPDDPPKQELAEERTDWAYDRTLLAAERTVAAWIRTALACGAVGLGATRLFDAVEPAWLARVLGVLLLALGAVVAVLGALGYRRTRKRLEASSMRAVSMWSIWLITVALIVGMGLGIAIVTFQWWQPML